MDTGTVCIGYLLQNIIYIIYQIGEILVQTLLGCLGVNLSTESAVLTKLFFGVALQKAGLQKDMWDFLLARNL